MNFATPENTRQQVGGLIHEPIQEHDHILGGLLGDVWEVVLPSGKWYSEVLVNTPMKDNPEIQVVSDGDLYWCVTFSNNSTKRLVWAKKYGGDFNNSERYLAIGSGTIRGRGNSKKGVAEWARKNGFVYQAECPTPNTLDEAYNPLTQDIITKGRENTKIVSFGYKYISNNSVKSIQDGLKYSPVQVDVQPYTYNSKGYVINNGSGYVHEVTILEDMGDFWAVWDSEQRQFLKYDKSYQFGSPMIHSVTKSNLTDEINKYEGKQVKASKSGIYLIQEGKKRPYPDKLIFYADGGLYGIDGTTYVNISDTLLNAIDLGQVIDLQETKYWPMIYQSYDAIKLLSEPANLQKVKEIVSEVKTVEQHYDGSQEDLWKKLLNYFNVK
jgi:hypothetical protein